MGDDGPEGADRLALETLWAERGVTAADLAPDSSGTIGRARTHPMPLDDDLANIEPEPAPLVRLGAVLARGGMGVVHLAEQPSLKRQVAVKQLKESVRSPAATTALLREAWIGGNLEHPSIVPLHALCQGEGSPLLVMKLIEGTSWFDLIHDPQISLERNLRILIQLCHAVHFAHSRGILHLDLKPDNVMVGRFGEVYLLDWGIATGFDDTRPDWLPHVSEIEGVGGTPEYMAPEQAAANNRKIGVHTDVFLLGAVLHEILTRTRRHQAGSPLEAAVRAFRSEAAVYDESVPRELGQIANRAAARTPGDRFPDAEAFRQAIEAFLEHRASTNLSDAATARLRVLGEATFDDEIEHDLLEARFGYRQALYMWPENPEAKEGLQRLLELMADRAIRERRPRYAAEYLREMPQAMPELEARLRHLRAQLADEAERVRLLDRDADPNLFHRYRAVMSLCTGLIWLVWNVACGALYRSGALAFELDQLILMGSASLAVFALGVGAVRRTLLTTALNRRAVSFFGAGMVTAILFWIAASVMGLHTLQAIALSFFVYVYFMITVALNVDRRALWAALILAPVAVVAPAWPEYAFEIGGAIGCFAGLWMAGMWWRPDPSGRGRPLTTRHR